jgi:hypothetical protein
MSGDLARICAAISSGTFPGGMACRGWVTSWDPLDGLFTALRTQENGADSPRESGAVRGWGVVTYFAAAYNAPTLFQSITFHRALR